MNQAILVDMQGTLGGEGLDDAMTFQFYPFAPEAIRLANQAGFLVIVVTNQSHIGKGLFTMEQFNQKMEELNRHLERVGAHIDDVYCCPHHSSMGCHCRKPLPYMVHEAQKDHDLDLTHSYVVGDTGAWDMLLAKNAGCRSVLVKTGLGVGSLGEYRHTWAGYEPDFVAEDVLEAVKWIVGQAGCLTGDSLTTCR